MDIQEIQTRAEAIGLIKAIKQRIRDVGGGRKFRIEENYCVGGSDRIYFLPEGEAMALLRRALLESGLETEGVESKSYEELRTLYSRQIPGWFDVTRPGCHHSSIRVEPTTEESES